MSLSVKSALWYLLFSLLGDLAAVLPARQSQLYVIVVAFAVARALVLAVATGSATRTIDQAAMDPRADAQPALAAAARLPLRAMRVTMAAALLSYAALLVARVDWLVCAVGLFLQVLASVLHRFILAGRLLEGPQRALVARSPSAEATVSSPLAVKLLWIVCAPTLAAALSVAAAARSAEPLHMAIAAVAAVVAGVVAAVLGARDIARTAERLAQSTERLAAGELSEPVAIATDDEHGRAAAALRKIAESIRRSSGSAGESMHIVGRHVAAVAGGAAEAAAAVRAGSGSLEAILEAASELERLSREVDTETERFGTVVRKLSDVAARTFGGGDTSILSDAETLRLAGETSGAAANELTSGIGKLAQAVQGLSMSSVETASSTSAMDDAIARVRLAANDTAELSARVSGEAERGYRAVHKTLDEIERIRDLVEEARRTIDDLGSRVSGIGQVVLVIEEIAQKTNLLALNASIIAAQAGQHGRGFAVVASEIKALAQRTAASTKEIAAQITGIQKESGRAMTAMATGVEAVNQGFQVAVGAGDALGEIRQSARAAQKKVQGIARAMEEQAGASRRVADATGQLASMSQQVLAAIREHAHGGQRIHAAAEEMAEVARRVEDRLRRTGQSTHELESSVADVMSLARDFSRLQKERLRAAERLDAAVASVREADALTAERVRQVTQVATLLRDEAAHLQRKLEEFKVA
jgi:methyl-accepting chemotaxis protein